MKNEVNYVSDMKKNEVNIECNSKLYDDEFLKCSKKESLWLRIVIYPCLIISLSSILFSMYQTMGAHYFLIPFLFFFGNIIGIIYFEKIIRNSIRIILKKTSPFYKLSLHLSLKSNRLEINNNNLMLENKLQCNIPLQKILSIIETSEAWIISLYSQEKIIFPKKETELEKFFLKELKMQHNIIQKKRKLILTISYFVVVISWYIFYFTQVDSFFLALMSLPLFVNILNLKNMTLISKNIISYSFQISIFFFPFFTSLYLLSNLIISLIDGL